MAPTPDLIESLYSAPSSTALSYCSRTSRVQSNLADHQTGKHYLHHHASTAGNQIPSFKAETNLHSSDPPTHHHTPDQLFKADLPRELIC